MSQSGQKCLQMWMLMNLGRLLAQLQNYHIYMDNFFSSVSLYKNLLLNKIYCTGTLRSNRRYFPPDLKPLVKKGMARKGDWAVRQEGNTCVTVWQDTRPVASISTGHNLACTKVVTRGKGKNMKALDCLECIFDYNCFMGGVFHGRGVSWEGCFMGGVFHGRGR